MTAANGSVRMADRLRIMWRFMSEQRIVTKPQTSSRLRYVSIIERSNETAEEKTYRRQNERLQEWNDKYWAENNKTFTQERDDYIRRNFGDGEALSHDQLADFYRDFLERNHIKHISYNRAWYRYHLSLLNSSFNAKLSRIRVNLRDAFRM